MSNFKKLLAASVASIAMVGVAHADISASGAQNFISSSTAPTASQVFSTGATVTVNNAAPSGGGTMAVIAANNVITLTLPAGVTFATEPTLSVLGDDTITKVSGGNGTGSFSVVVSSIGVNTTGDGFQLSNINVQGVPSAANGQTITLTISDQAGLVLPTNSSARSATIANFRNLFTTQTVAQGQNAGAGNAAAGTIAAATGTALANTISISGTSPGTAFAAADGSNAQASTSSARLGLVRLQRNASIVNWGGAPITAGAATFTVTLPAGNPPFGTPVATASSNCDAGLTGAALTVSAISGNAFTATLPAGAVQELAAAGGDCDVSFSVPLVASNTTFIPRGGSTVTASLTNTNGPTSSSPQSVAAGTFSSFDYVGGTPHVLGYVAGSDARYTAFVSVATAAAAGPVIVNAATAGGTGSAVVTTSQAQNTTVLYPIGSGTNSIRDALIQAGMSGTTFADGSQRGQLTVIAPTGARVAYLQVGPDGTVTEIGRFSPNN